MEEQNTSAKALVLGSTGLIGRALVTRLLEGSEFSVVHTFQRRKGALTHPKLIVHEVDFSQPASPSVSGTGWMHKLTGEALFLCMGTTLKKAGSKEAQWKVDYEYQLDAAKAAHANGVPVCVVVSAAGADPDSRLFYSRMKGQLEIALEQLNFERLVILQPSFLDGDRSERRIGESIGIFFAKLFAWVPGIRKYRPVADDTVAEAMVKAAIADQGPKTRRIELDQIFEVAKN